MTGLVVVALSLLGVASLFLFFGGLEHPQAVPYQLVGFGFGASLVALFAQLGRRDLYQGGGRGRGPGGQG